MLGSKALNFELTMISVLLPVIGFIIFIYSIILHEIAHGLMAERLGDPTARISGRLTLNPFPHIDPFLSIILPLFLVLANFPVIIGAAKPVPIDPYNLQSPRKDMGFVGLAGPATNLLLALFLATVARILPFPFFDQAWYQFLANVSLLNIFLAVFNLIPIPPLDGGRVLVAILPPKYAEAVASLENLGIFIVLFLLLFPTPFFSLQKVIFNISLSILNFIFPTFHPV